MSVTTKTGSHAPVWQRLLAVGIGLFIALAGFLIGNTSYQVTYKQVTDTQITHYISGDSSNDHKSYMQIQDNDQLFVVNESDMSPQFSASALGDGEVSLVYRTDQTENIDVTSTSGTHLKGSAYTVIALGVLGSQQVFATSTYANNPNGFYDDRWAIGKIIIGFGLVVALLSIFIGERILVVVYTALAGAVIGPVVYVAFVGVFEVGGSSGGSWLDALRDNLILLGVIAAIGLVIGFIVGIVRAITGND